MDIVEVALTSDAVTISRQKILIILANLSPSEEVSSQLGLFDDLLCNYAATSTMICEDFNAKSPLWGEGAQGEAR